MGLAHNIDENQRTEDIQISQETTFDTMMLSPNILDGLLSAGFYKPSPIQLLGIPLGKLGLDLLLEAKSGTGKTVVFSTIALEALDLKKGLQVIIITPTREIAVQICDVLNQIGSKYDGLSIEVLIGGLSYKDDVAKMQKKVHIIVGTPGRLKYLIQDNHIDVSATRLLVLDEADKLMDKSFHEDIRYIHSALPQRKQIIMSSATYPETVMESINELVHDAQHVCPNSSNVLLGVSHRVTYVSYNSNSVRQTELRFAELIKIFTEIQFKQCVIFCKYQARVTQLHKMLTKAKWPSELVFGKQEQTVRLGALKTLQEYKCRILISTDLVARGIDAKNVDLVINFEPPDTCETYLHRIGRSGRYGSIGMAISIISEGTEKNKFKQMLEHVAKTVDLKQLWTEETIGVTKMADLNERDIIKSFDPKEVNTNENLENLWHSLISEKNETNIVENFDQLCSSYSETNIEQSKRIESFSDLLENYKSNESEKIFEDIVSVEYKQMKLDDYPCKNYLKAVRNLKEKLHISQININSEHMKETRFSQDSQNKKDKITKEHTRSELTNTEEQVKKEIGYKEQHTNYLHISEKNPDMKSKCNETYINANAFLLQVPKSFHISTTKQESSNKSMKKEKVNRGKMTDIQFNDRKISSNKCSVKLDHAESKCQNYKSAKSQNSKDLCNVNSPVTLCNKNSVYFADSNHHNVSREITYYKWFNNLKSNMKQIEQFMYLDELSKPL